MPKPSRISLQQESRFYALLRPGSHGGKYETPQRREVIFSVVEVADAFDAVEEGHLTGGPLALLFHNLVEISDWAPNLAAALAIDGRSNDRQLSSR